MPAVPRSTVKLMLIQTSRDSAKDAIAAETTTNLALIRGQYHAKTHRWLGW